MSDDNGQIDSCVQCDEYNDKIIELKEQIDTLNSENNNLKQEVERLKTVISEASDLCDDVSRILEG